MPLSTNLIFDVPLYGSKTMLTTISTVWFNRLEIRKNIRFGLIVYFLQKAFSHFAGSAKGSINGHADFERTDHTIRMIQKNGVKESLAFFSILSRFD